MPRAGERGAGRAPRSGPGRPLTAPRTNPLRPPAALGKIASTAAFPDRSGVPGEAASLDVTGYQPRWGGHVSLRLVMLHLIHEYARHNGHADFLREAIDGTVGA